MNNRCNQATSNKLARNHETTAPVTTLNTSHNNNCPKSATRIIQDQPNNCRRRAPISAITTTITMSPTAALFSSSRKSFLFGVVLITLAVLLIPPAPLQQHRNSVQAAKTLKSLAKTFVFQRLTQRKHFVPLPVPIPVPIEINEKPIYLKGKPKYVNVYQKPKPTPQPATKPTTVYHMPIYSPTYEYMSMDPMSSAMYNSPMMYAGQQYGGGQQSVGGASSYKSSVNTDGDSTSSSASASHSGVDYDDDAGNYYTRKAAAARRNKLQASVDYGGYDFDLHRNDQSNNNDLHDEESEHHARQSETDPSIQQQHQQQQHQQQDLATSGSNMEEDDIEAPLPNDDESYDHESDDVPQHRVKRQVYYQSGYDGEANCEGFPLEINVRSRIKLDRIFPIHGKSQIKKCVKFKKSLLPPPPAQDEY